MYRLGLVGYPLEHSLSPMIHGSALRIANINGDYRLYPVPPSPQGMAELGQLISKMRHGKLKGLNITIPYKQAIMEYLDVLTPAAQAIGAVNTLFMSDGKLVGDNSDAPGFMADLENICSKKTVGREVSRVLVLGAGGAARAVVYALGMAGWEVIIAARRLKQASDLVTHILHKIPDLKNTQSVPTNASELNGRFPIRAIDLNELPVFIQQTDPIHLVVNATSVGMFPDIYASPWPEHLELPASAMVYDLVYNPEETLFLHRARQQGHLAWSGWGMLVEQALISFEKWTGIAVPRQLVVQSLSIEGKPD